MIEPFYPDRMASRILGMGDVLSLIEKAEKNFDLKQAEQLEKKLREASFTLSVFLEQFRQIKNMGNLQDILAMVPGASSLKNVEVDEKAMAHTEAIILSIKNSEIINSVTKLLYPTVAKNHGTTSSRVERAIRHAIEVAWDRGDIDVLNSYFGYTIQNDRGKPTNSEFIAMISDKLILRLKIS